MHYHGNASRLFSHIPDHVKIQLRGSEVNSVGSAKGTSQRVHSGFFHKLSGKDGIRINFRVIPFALSCARLPLSHGT